MTKRQLHCWARGPVLDDGMPTTCMLRYPHEGPHEWTRDEDIKFQFAPVAASAEAEIGNGK